MSTDVLFEAAKAGDAAEVRILLDKDPLGVRAADDHLKTALHWAAERDHAEVAKVLIDAGADVEAKTTWGATPLDWAATMGSAKVADLLLAHGARGMNLAMAAGLGKLDLVREFLASGDAAEFKPGHDDLKEPDDHWPADSARRQGDLLSHAFYSACRNGQTAAAALLLEHGAGVNAKGVFGGTGMHWAAINGHEATVAFLLAHGADRTIHDAKFDSTPEGWAAEGGREEIRELLRHG